MTITFRLNKHPNRDMVDWSNGHNIKVMEALIIKRGLNYRDTAKKLGLSYDTVSQGAIKLGLNSQHKNSKLRARQLTSKEVDLVVELKAIGTPTADCAEVINIGTTTLGNLLTANPEIYGRINKRKRELRQDVIKRLTNGKTQT